LDIGSGTSHNDYKENSKTKYNAVEGRTRVAARLRKQHSGQQMGSTVNDSCSVKKKLLLQ